MRRLQSKESHQESEGSSLVSRMKKGLVFFQLISFKSRSKTRAGTCHLLVAALGRNLGDHPCPPHNAHTHLFTFVRSKRPCDFSDVVCETPTLQNKNCKGNQNHHKRRCCCGRKGCVPAPLPLSHRFFSTSVVPVSWTEPWWSRAGVFP